MSKSDNCKDGISKSSSDDVCELAGKLHKLSTDNLSVCANCGKEGSDINNICNKCNQVKYCNASCKKKHRHKHKKECEEHVRLAAELHDEELFKQPPPAEDCPICFIRMPSLLTGYVYYSCCGKIICNGCAYAPVYDDQGNQVDNHKCPFCRTPNSSSDEETTEREKKRMDLNDPIAIYNNGCNYEKGTDGFPQDYVKALELWHRAGELGDTASYDNIGFAYDNGQGVEVDEKKAVYYYELAAMGGDVHARHNVGIGEENAGNVDRALKHYMIAVKDGHANSLQEIQDLFSNGHATKEDYTKALRAYQEYLSEIKSRQRDEAAAAHKRYRYY